MRSCNQRRKIALNAAGALPGSVVIGGFVVHAACKSTDTRSSLKSNPSESEIIDWCVAYLAKSLDLVPERIDPHTKFTRLGMDSAASVFLVSDLEEWLGLELSVEVIVEHQTPAALAHYLAARCAGHQSATG
jgi:acyl carrier protein